jgi:hypothetical protein
MHSQIGGINVGIFRKLALAGIAVLSSISISPSRASDAFIDQALVKAVGTTSTKAEPTFNAGVLTGCTVIFNTLIRDFTYRGGGFVRVDGSFAVMVAKNNIGVLLKLVLNDFDPGTYAVKPGKPVSALFVRGTTTSAPFLLSAIETETPGSVFAVFDGAKTFPILVNSVADRIVTVSFARTRGSTDVLVPIDLSVEDTDKDGNRIRSDKTGTVFNSCVIDLIDKEQERLKQARSKAR